MGSQNGLSYFQTMAAYLEGSAFQTVGDNPVTAYRQLVQHYAKDLQGNVVDPKVASKEAKVIFIKNNVGASLYIPCIIFFKSDLIMCRKS